MKKETQMSGQNPNVLADKLEALRTLVPEAFVEGQLDPAQLAEILGTNTTSTNEDGERYGLNWPGKKLAYEEVAKQTYCTLTHDEAASSEDWQNSNNIFIEGENLETLRVLQKAYFNKVKMIYIDPPYNTGKDFVYHDNFRQTEEEYCDECNVTENGHLKKALKLNTRDSGRFHSDWLTMMYPRLFLARNLLRDDGVIFVSIDDNEVHNLRMLMNEIFGEENFVGSFIWHKKLTGGYDNHHLNTQHDYILAFTKDVTKLQITFEKKESDYTLVDEDGRKYKWDSLWNVGGLQYSKTLDYPINAPDGTEIWPVGERGVSFWLWSKEKVENEKDKLKFTKNKNGEWRVYKRIYASDALVPGSMLDKDIVKGNTFSSREMKNMFGWKLFDYAKPTPLIQYLAARGTSLSENDIILDFFSGSGTTAHAVMAQNAADGGNRQYICVQLPEETPEGSEARKAGYERISDIALERIKRAAQKIKTENPDYTGDLGVRVYRATDSHFPTWRAKSYESDAELRTAMFDYVNKLPYGTPAQRADEVLLKLGYPLTTLRTDQGGWYMAGDVALILDENFDQKRLFTDVLGTRPSTVIVLEQIFKTDEEKINFDLRCTEANVIFQTI